MVQVKKNGGSLKNVSFYQYLRYCYIGMTLYSIYKGHLMRMLSLRLHHFFIKVDLFEHVLNLCVIGLVHSDYSVGQF